MRKQFLLQDIVHVAELWLDGLLIFLCPCQHSLMVLMERMYSANPHFVRCIKPNNQKEPGVLDNEVVLLQVSKSGVLYRDFCHISVEGQIPPKGSETWLRRISPARERVTTSLYMCKDSEYLVVFVTQTARSRFCNLRSLPFLLHECNEICLSGARIHLCISPWIGLVQTVPWKNCFPEETVLAPQPGQLWIETKMGLLW